MLDGYEVGKSNVFEFDGETLLSKKKSDEELREEIILSKTADIWSFFNYLEQTHPSDKEDMANAIHDIQKIIAVRIARRTNPDQFVTIK